VSHNVSEGRRAVEAARKYGKICQTGTQCRSMIGTIDAIAYVHAGKIGEVKLARGLCYKRRPAIGARGEYKVPETVDYDLWCGPAATLPLTRPKFHYDWHWQWEYGNGDLGNQGIHQMDIARWGLQAAGVGDSVYSFGGRVGYVDAGETANTQVSVHTFGDKTLVFEVRGLPTEQYKGAGVGVVFHGTEGYVVLTSYDAGAVFDPKGNMITAFKGSGDHYGNFVDAVRARDPGLLRADIEEGHLSSALCHLGNISYRVGETVTLGELRERLAGMPSREAGLEALERMTAHLAANQLDASTRVACGQALTIDPAKETFTGRGADFNAMLTRPGRAPFLVPAAGQV
jgi:predicted dehydrogenase